MSGVLAVMDDCICYLSAQDNLAGYELEQVTQARATVAEYERVMGKAIGYLFVCGLRGDKGAIGLHDEIVAALARAGGDA